MRAAVLAALMAAACGGAASRPSEPARPSHWRYTCTRDRVLTAVVAAMRKQEPPVAVEDREAGFIATELAWRSARGERKHSSEALHRGDLGLVVEVAVVDVPGAREVRGAPRVFEPGPEGKGRELSRGQAGWPRWADEALAGVFDHVARGLSSCAAP